MLQFLDYYGFAGFTVDQSKYFKQITFTFIKDDYYLVIEKDEEQYHIHLTTYDDEKSIGKQNPKGLNTLIKDFKLDNNDHRKMIQQYLDYN